ncbi:MAG: S1 RNA-binding domain-containing protein [Planctomycetaceae bacterium]
MSSEAPQSEDTQSDGVATPQTPATEASPAAPASVGNDQHVVATEDVAAGEAHAAHAEPEAAIEPDHNDPDKNPSADGGSETMGTTDNQAESAQAESAQAESAQADGTAADATPARRRPKLKSASHAQAIPSFAPGTATPTPTPTDDKQSDGDTDASAVPVQTPPPADVTPVDVPLNQNLDADLEAEIAAALSTDSETAGLVSSDAGVASESSADEESTEENVEPGTRLSGQVESIDQEHVFVELGFRSPGIIQIRQFESAKPPQVGQSLDVVVDRVDEADGLIVLSLPRGKRRVGGDWNAISRGQVVDCMVNKTNKGGLEVSVSSLRGFLPAGQVDLAYVSDLEVYVGQKLTVQITEVNPKKRNLVVSRRALLIEERKAHEQEVWESIEIGQTHTGQVKTLKDYGAFIDIGNVDGFLHIGEISWSRINHPSDVLTVGQSVDVKIISLDPEKKRIGLGMRQLAQNPWNLAEDKYPSGSSVTGKVTRAAQFGAFVELEAGVEGLIHISELDYNRVNRVTDVLQVGQDVEVKILSVDTERKRISLSLKAMNPAPERAETAVEQEDETTPELEKAREAARENLKGGMGGGPHGGLFGNPGDYGK